MDDPGSPIFGPILLILLLTLVNAFLAGAEMAFVSLDPSKIKDKAEKGDRKARRVLLLLASPDAFLSAIQVGITFAGFFNSAQASQAFLARLVPILGTFPAAQTVASLILTLIISYVSLVLGELYPKQLALQVPDSPPGTDNWLSVWGQRVKLRSTVRLPWPALPVRCAATRGRTPPRVHGRGSNSTSRRKAPGTRRAAADSARPSASPGPPPARSPS